MINKLMQWPLAAKAVDNLVTLARSNQIDYSSHLHLSKWLSRYYSIDNIEINIQMN